MNANAEGPEVLTTMSIVGPEAPPMTVEAVRSVAEVAPWATGCDALVVSNRSGDEGTMHDLPPLGG